MARNFILFTSDLFVYDQVDSDIDRWLVGGDCCGWFYMRLLLLKNVQLGFPPVMEDWGWTFSVTANEIPVTINTWAYYEIPKCWLMGLYVRERRFFKPPDEKRSMARDIVADGIESIVRNDDRFDRHCWMNDNPFDTGIKAFFE